MSAETLRRAAAEIRDEWSENRQMGQDRTEWRTWRAVADWLEAAARRMPDDCDCAECLAYEPEALAVARAYLGEG